MPLNDFLLILWRNFQIINLAKSLEILGNILSNNTICVSYPYQYPVNLESINISVPKRDHK
jgi:hypothetical protein